MILYAKHERRGIPLFEYAEYIYAVYKERSFSKAADKLFITQPSLSITIKKAEAALGMPVFNRSTVPVSLTPFGVEYIQAVEQLRLVERSLRESVEKSASLQSGSLAVGSSNLSEDFFVTRQIAAFHRRCPQIDLTVRRLNTLQSKHQLDAGELDFVITSRPFDEKKYAQRVCYREQLLLAVPEGFAVNESLAPYRLKQDELGKTVFTLPRERRVRLNQCGRIPFVLLSNENYLRENTDMMFRECGVSPRIVLEMEQSAASLNFARLGLGATILSNLLVENDPRPGLCYYAIDSTWAEREAFLTSRRGVWFTYAMRKFEQMLMQQDS